MRRVSHVLRFYAFGAILRVLIFFVLLTCVAPLACDRSQRSLLFPVGFVFGLFKVSGNRQVGLPIEEVKGKVVPPVFCVQTQPGLLRVLHTNGPPIGGSLALGDSLWR